MPPYFGESAGDEVSVAVEDVDVVVDVVDVVVVSDSEQPARIVEQIISTSERQINIFFISFPFYKYKLLLD
jgi:hypothetical protein